MRLAEILIIVSLAMLIGSRVCGAQARPAGEAERTEAARRRFLEIARIARLPEGTQKREIPHLYHEMFLEATIRRYAVGGFEPWQNLIKRLNAGAPEGLADQLDKQGGWVALSEAARTLCLALINRHPRELMPLVLADLTTNEQKPCLRALELIGEADLLTLTDTERLSLSRTEIRKRLLQSPFQAALDPILDIYVTTTDPYLSDRSRTALMRLDNPRALERLLAALPRTAALNDYSHVLSQLSEARPAHPKLLAALRSENLALRRVAAGALAASGDDRLRPWVKTLAHDGDPEQRKSAAAMAAHLKPKTWEKARPIVVALLSDPNSSVRVQAASLLVSREGKAFARTLLQMIQDNSLPMQDHATVLYAIHYLAGQQFGYSDGHYRDDSSWRPTTPESRAAIARFAQWIETNVVPEKTP